MATTMGWWRAATGGSLRAIGLAKRRWPLALLEPYRIACVACPGHALGKAGPESLRRTRRVAFRV
jgi:hypothetical protein